MSMVLSFTLWLLMGIATAYIARQRGRDPFIWFAIGMFFGVLGLLLLMILPSYAEDSTANSSMPDASTQTIEVVAIPIEKHSDAYQGHDYLIKDWFCLDKAHQQQGPMRFEALRTLWKEEKIGPLSFVWCEGMEQWKKINELSNLKEALNN